MKIACLSSLVLASLAASACGGGTPPPEEPALAPTEAADPGVAEPAADPGPAPAEPAPPPEAPAAEAGPDVRQREITQRECRALGGKYAELTRSDETAKLSPKLTAAQKAQAAESIDGAARKLEARWVESCEASLVGKVAEEAAIMCAMNAKNVAAFDTCLNGPR